MAKKANNNNAPALDQTSIIASIVAEVMARINSTPASAPAPASVKRQAAVMANIYPEVSAEQHTAAAAAWGRPVVSTKAPEGLCAHIGEGKHAQVKLPSALFDGFSTIVLTFPNGAEKAIDVDSEGRARMTVKQACELSGACVGQYLKFEPTHAGYFAVNVVNGIPKTEDKAETSKAKTAPRAVAPVPVPVPVKAVPVPVASVVPAKTTRFGAMFDTFDAVAHAGKQTSKADAKADDKRRTSKRTPAQKAATERMLAARAAKKAAKESGVVVDGGPVTPRYVTPDVMPKGARSTPVPNVGAAQTAFANGQKAQTKADAIINSVTGKGAAYTVPPRKR